jgi:hypothetical protein
MSENLRELFAAFFSRYNEEEKNAIWKSQSERFRDFWHDRIMTDRPGELDDIEIDEIVRILDRMGRGNTAASEAIARVMIPQGAWRRMFNEIKARKLLRDALDRIFQDSDNEKRAAAIDELYAINRDGRNNLTGQSGHAVSAMLAAHDPFSNVSAVSLKDRRNIIEYFGFGDGPDFASDPVGKKIVVSNAAILEGFRRFGITDNARTVSVFLYSSGVKELWKIGQEEDDAP